MSDESYSREAISAAGAVNEGSAHRHHRVSQDNHNSKPEEPRNESIKPVSAASGAEGSAKSGRNADGHHDRPGKEKLRDLYESYRHGDADDRKEALEKLSLALSPEAHRHISSDSESGGVAEESDRHSISESKDGKGKADRIDDGDLGDVQKKIEGKWSNMLSSMDQLLGSMWSRKQNGASSDGSQQKSGGGSSANESEDKGSSAGIISKIADSIGSRISRGYEDLASHIDESVKDAASKAGKGVGGAVSRGVNGIGEAASKAGSGIGSFISHGVESVGDAASKAGSGIGSFISHGVESVGDAASKAGSGIGSFISHGVESVGDAASKAGSGIGSFISHGLDSISDAGSDVSSSLNNLITRTEQGFINAGSYILNGTGGLLDGIPDTGSLADILGRDAKNLQKSSDLMTAVRDRNPDNLVSYIDQAVSCATPEAIGNVNQQSPSDSFLERQASAAEESGKSGSDSSSDLQPYSSTEQSYDTASAISEQSESLKSEIGSYDLKLQSDLQNITSEAGMNLESNGYAAQSELDGSGREIIGSADHREGQAVTGGTERQSSLDSRIAAIQDKAEASVEKARTAMESSVNQASSSFSSKVQDYDSSVQSRLSEINSQVASSASSSQSSSSTAGSSQSSTSQSSTSQSSAARSGDETSTKTTSGSAAADSKSGTAVTDLKSSAKTTPVTNTAPVINTAPVTNAVPVTKTDKSGDKSHGDVKKADRAEQKTEPKPVYRQLLSRLDELKSVNHGESHHSDSKKESSVIPSIKILGKDILGSDHKDSHHDDRDIDFKSAALKSAGVVSSLGKAEQNEAFQAAQAQTAAQTQAQTSAKKEAPYSSQPVSSKAESTLDEIRRQADLASQTASQKLVEVQGSVQPRLEQMAGALSGRLDGVRDDVSSKVTDIAASVLPALSRPDSTQSVPAGRSNTAAAVESVRSTISSKSADLTGSETASTWKGQGEAITRPVQAPDASRSTASSSDKSRAQDSEYSDTGLQSGISDRADRLIRKAGNEMSAQSMKAPAGREQTGETEEKHSAQSSEPDSKMKKSEASPREPSQADRSREHRADSDGKEAPAAAGRHASKEGSAPEAGAQSVGSGRAANLQRDMRSEEPAGKPGLEPGESVSKAASQQTADAKKASLPGSGATTQLPGAAGNAAVHKDEPAPRNEGLAKTEADVQKLPPQQKTAETASEISRGAGPAKDVTTAGEPSAVQAVIEGARDRVAGRSEYAEGRLLPGQGAVERTSEISRDGGRIRRDSDEKKIQPENRAVERPAEPTRDTGTGKVESAPRKEQPDNTAPGKPADKAGGSVAGKIESAIRKEQPDSTAPGKPAGTVHDAIAGRMESAAPKTQPENRTAEKPADQARIEGVGKTESDIGKAQHRQNPVEKPADSASDAGKVKLDPALQGKSRLEQKFSNMLSSVSAEMGDRAVRQAREDARKTEISAGAQKSGDSVKDIHQKGAAAVPPLLRSEESAGSAGRGRADENARANAQEASKGADRSAEKSTMPKVGAGLLGAAPLQPVPPRQADAEKTESLKPAKDSNDISGTERSAGTPASLKRSGEAPHSFDRAGEGYLLSTRQELMPKEIRQDRTGDSASEAVKEDLRLSFETPVNDSQAISQQKASTMVKPGVAAAAASDSAKPLTAATAESREASASSSLQVKEKASESKPSMDKSVGERIKEMKGLDEKTVAPPYGRSTEPIAAISEARTMVTMLGSASPLVGAAAEGSKPQAPTGDRNELKKTDSAISVKAVQEPGKEKDSYEGENQFDESGNDPGHEKVTTAPVRANRRAAAEEEPTPAAKAPKDSLINVRLEGEKENVAKTAGEANAKVTENRQVSAKQEQAAVQNATTSIESVLKKSQGEDWTGNEMAAKLIYLLMKSSSTFTFEHSSRVIDLSADLAREMGVTDEKKLKTIKEGAMFHDLGETELDLRGASPQEQARLSKYIAAVDLKNCSFLHDIGKVKIPDSILYKPGRLTDEEFNVLKQHPVIGEEILKPIPSMQHVLPVVRHHHEKWDGKGYPDGLAGENIPFEARIVGLTDAYDAMVSDRPYRKGMPVSDAIAEVKRCAGTHFDPSIVEAFVKMIERTGQA